ncbi:MAG: proline--tRNA ligase, partial [Planctomycetes bacterium]|nr:proline--tRNA ligase [Planctomycetota bacterium]
RGAREETLRMLDVYADFAEDVLALPVVKGRKTESEKFPGADVTFCIEGLMQDGKALQMGTSHHLGQNFAKAFDIQFAGSDGQRQHAWTTSWGVSTRLIGALVMAHGDDRGIVLPPRIAPIQVVLVPIFKTEEEHAAIREQAGQIAAMFKGSGVRFRFDDREQLKPGAKFFEWEKKGVPVRLELGPRDLAAGQVMRARRDQEGKSALPISGLGASIPALLAEIQTSMLERATRYRDENTVPVSTMEEFVARLEGPGGFLEAYCDGTNETENAIKAQTKATIRVVLDDAAEGRCILTGKTARRKALFARAY